MATSTFDEGAVFTPAPKYSLFDSNAVGIATFFGSPVAGGALMAWNYQHLGKTGKAVLTMVLAAIVTGLVVLVGWNLKPGVTSVFGLILFIAMTQLAKAVQGGAVSTHVQQGGALGSKWTAFGLGIAFLAVLFGSVVAYMMATADRNSVKIGKDSVYYEDGATREQAQAVGNALKAAGFFSDRGVAISVSKDKDGPVISFPVEDGLWNQADKVASFEEVGRQMAPLLGGYPIKVRLQNTSHDLKKEEVVGKAEFPGKDDVFYQGGVTQAQAQGVGEALKAADFFEGSGVDVFVAKDGGTTTIAFVTNSKAWTDPAMTSGFEKLARAAAPALGGLPVHLQLEDNTLVVKKDELVSP